MTTTRIVIGIGLVVLIGFIAYGALPKPDIQYGNDSVTINFQSSKTVNATIVAIGEVRDLTLDGTNLGGYISPIVTQENEVSGVQYGSGDNLYDLDMDVYNAVKSKVGPGITFYVLPTIEATDKNPHTLVIYSGNPNALQLYTVSKNGIKKIGGT